MRIGVRPQVMPLGDDSLEQRRMLRLADVVASDKKARVDAARFERVEDVLGALAVIAAGEDQADLLAGCVAADDPGVVECPVWICRGLSASHGAEENETR